MKLNIHKPCSEKWDAMQNSPHGKFCKLCSKHVVDFTDKTEKEIWDIFNRAGGKEVCGRLPLSFSKIAAGVILITNLTFSQGQTPSPSFEAIEQSTTSFTKLSGKLIFKINKKGIPGAEVIFIHKNQYIKTQTDKNGNFTLEIPNELISKKNVLYFNFNVLNEKTIANPERKIPNVAGGDIYENTTIIFTKDEKIVDKTFVIESQKFYLGGISIMTDSPPDYYFFDGKNISEKKFRKLQEENPGYSYFVFEGKEAQAIANKSYIRTLRLLYSNKSL